MNFNWFYKIIYWLNKPQISILLILIFIITYLSFEQGILKKNNFFNIGPTKDKDGNPTTYLGIELNTWKKVILVYFLIFISSILQYYYSNVMKDFHSSLIIDTLIIPRSKILTYILVMIDPFINTLLYIIKFFATATFQLQFILPQFLADYIVKIPKILILLNRKQFI